MSEPSSAILSSDILENQFGPISVDILGQYPGVRIIRTLASNGKVLELSKVAFRSEADKTFPEAHRHMSTGKSMGKAFRDIGIPFKRHTNAVYTYELPGGFRQRFKTGGKATVVEVSILAGKDQQPYADILEIYAPTVEWSETVTELTAIASDKLEEFDRLLTALGF